MTKVCKFMYYRIFEYFIGRLTRPKVKRYFLPLFWTYISFIPYYLIWLFYICINLKIQNILVSIFYVNQKLFNEITALKFSVTNYELRSLPIVFSISTSVSLHCIYIYYMLFFVFNVVVVFFFFVFFFFFYFFFYFFFFFELIRGLGLVGLS